MKISIIFCHYKTGKMSAYAVHQLLKHKGTHEIEILICDNNPGDGSIETLNPYLDSVKVIDYPKGVEQSHGLGYEVLMDYVSNEYFITMESDSFPIQDDWLDYYENLISQGYDMAGSKMKLSGGEYIHPAGAMYRKSVWKEAKAFVKYVNSIYHYYPNLGMKDLFPCHIMSHEKLSDFENKHHSYNNVTFDEQLERYLPIAQSVFHNGMGSMQESFATYGQRNIESGTKDVGENFKDTIIYRMGYEPGQWFSYWHHAVGKKVFNIPTQIEWMQGRVNQQQAFTCTENGLKHLWAVTAYHGSTEPSTKDISDFKNNQMNELYNSIK